MDLTDDDLTNDNLTDEEIVQAVMHEHQASEEVEDEEGNTVSQADARNALQLASLYIEQQNMSTVEDVMFIKKWRDYAFKKTMEYKKQKITEFF
ncbi:unnamed protein product [Diabrotica balteata]|uniref:Uncharacterized protein n=1 Tax=Diabrotica balteata TaxID=107213 RepID=A0A9N9SUR5_DIABA|nr:unnamed protein product [Diabrotica balteata]